MFTVLLDAPDGPAKRIQIARLGPVKDRRYGEFEIGEDNVRNWQNNLKHLPGGRSLIDFEHASERSPRNSEAAGWITGIDLDGTKVMADVEWSDKGEDAVRNKRYLFLSPAYGPHEDELGNTYDDTLCSVALTNKPKLGSLPMLTLASEERVSEAIDEDPALRFHTRALDGDYGDHTQALVMLDVSQAERDRAHANGHSLPDKSYPINDAKQLHSAAVLAASGHGDAAAAKKLIRRRAKDLGVDVTTLPGFAADAKKMDADSRASNMANEALLKLLDLDDSADDATLLEAITSLKQTADDAAKLQRKLEKKPLKTLEQQAQDSGLKLLDATAYTELTRKADAGDAAMKQLHEQRFENAFELALNHADGAKVLPAEKASLQHFYTLDADATIKLIEDREPLVSAKPKGQPALQLDADADPAQVAAAGVHPGSHDLHSRINKYLLDNKLPQSHYIKVLEQLNSGAVAL